MKKTACWLLILSMLLLLALPAGAAEKTPAFADAGDIRNGYAVRMLVDLGLIVGDNDGNFRPAAPITRAETAKLIACLCTDTFLQTGGASFADTAESWARDYIAYCASRGIVGGSGGYFRPQDDVTAQELAKMLLVVTGSDGARYTGAGWSERVNADAEKYGLYHAFSGRYDLPVTRDDACLLIYNAMQRPAVDGENADGTPRYVLDALMNKRTYLEVRFDAVRYTAVLTGNEYADLTRAENLPPERQSWRDTRSFLSRPGCGSSGTASICICAMARSSARPRRPCRSACSPSLTMRSLSASAPETA